MCSPVPYNSTMKVTFLLYGFCLFSANALDSKDAVITISSQSNNYHYLLAENLKNDILKQARDFDQVVPIVHVSHIDFPHVGGWAILPLIPYLRKLHHGNCSWFFFMEDKTRIRLKKLIEVLGKYDYNKEIWLGHAIQDREATIIHHFAFFEDPSAFKYPNAASGFAISAALMERLENRWKARKPSTSDFSIDYAHELALFIWDNNKGPTLKHDPSFCVNEESSCASFPVPFKLCYTSVPKSSIYFAVKTYEKFHKDRVTVVKNTWGKHAEFINFFSNVEDKSVPTISVGVPNTEQGHCEKTLAILKHVGEDLRKFPSIKWIVLADDDTILSVTRIQELLSCYDNNSLIAIGERYGYNIYNKNGYNYITGGGGIVFTSALLRQLISSKICKCPTISSPDDMFLGVCLNRLKVDITHSSLFHQARPMDYAPEYLENQPVVSFHKHWMIDPVSIYIKWFADADASIRSLQHSEL
ncbi:hypothetical protein RN001_011826 [Aquatica leii]|uniref:Fringe-like glycosyltransferase domain-containing protein n=1 Tax=Aquatica leii TaxID=1421715 RepID=A0AAN7PS99_9COLE|nr:hypothetical protein RN001_011826 [Aquatica leii]